MSWPYKHCQWGQTQAHAVAIALEKLAAAYRRLAEEQQDLPWDPIEGDGTERSYHVTVHYEHVIEAVSVFYAMHDTQIGNTIAENAKLTMIQVDPELPIEPFKRSWT